MSPAVSHISSKTSAGWVLCLAQCQTAGEFLKHANHDKQRLVPHSVPTEKWGLLSGSAFHPLVLKMNHNQGDARCDYEILLNAYKSQFYRHGFKLCSLKNKICGEQSS